MSSVNLQCDFLIGLLVAERRLNAPVRNLGERLEHRLENWSRTIGRHSHADLFPDAFFGSDESEVIGKGLETGSFTIRQSAILGPVVDVGATASAAGHRV